MNGSRGDRAARGSAERAATKADCDGARSVPPLRFEVRTHGFTEKQADSDRASDRLGGRSVVAQNDGLLYDGDRAKTQSEAKQPEDLHQADR